MTAGRKMTSIWFSIQKRNRMADKALENKNEVSRKRLAETAPSDADRLGINRHGLLPLVGNVRLGPRKWS